MLTLIEASASFRVVGVATASGPAGSGRGDRTLQEIASKHQVHPNQVSAGAAPQRPAPRAPGLPVSAQVVNDRAGEPRGPQTDRVLAGFRRDGADRGRGQAAPLRADGLAAILATADRSRVTGRGFPAHAGIDPYRWPGRCACGRLPPHTRG